MRVTRAVQRNSRLFIRTRTTYVYTLAIHTGSCGFLLSRASLQRRLFVRIIPRVSRTGTEQVKTGYYERTCESRNAARRLMAVHTGWVKWKHWHKQQRRWFFTTAKSRVHLRADNKQKLIPSWKARLIFSNANLISLDCRYSRVFTRVKVFIIRSIFSVK